MSEENQDSVTAFLLLLTAGEKTEEILNQLRDMSEVVEGYIIYGEWDLILKIRVKNLPDLTEIVMKLRKNAGIKKTSTLIALTE
jgi:anthranilate phosphoribosyltransferase